MRTVSAISLAFALATTSLPLGSSQAQEVEIPARKPGQWQITMNMPAPIPAMAMEACVDAESDKKMMLAGLSASKEMCPDQTMRRDGDTIVIDSTCKVGETNTKSHVVISGDFQSAYTVDITTESSGGMPGAMTMKQEARWVGPECTGGLQPGEMMMPGGAKVNVNQMMNMMGGG